MNQLLQILDGAPFSPVTKQSYARAISYWIEFAGPSPMGWTRIRAQEFYDSLVARGVKLKTAEGYLASLRYVSKWYAIRAGRPELDFAIVQLRGNTREQPRMPAKPRRALTPEEATALLGTCRPTKARPTPIDERDLAMLVVGLETGMRKKSLLGLNREGLGKSRHGYPIADVPIKGAGGAQRWAVPLSDVAYVSLSHWLKHLRSLGASEGPVFQGLQKRIGASGRNEFIPHGGLSEAAIYKIIERRAELAGIDRIHPHLLRHTFISWRQAEGLNPVEISAITGHRVFSDGWQSMAMYVDLDAKAQTARNSTPPWFAALVGGLYA